MKPANTQTLSQDSMSLHQPHRSPKPQPTAAVGAYGERLVAQWLQRRGWMLLQQRWHCRWGELDLIMGQPIPESSQFALIAFVEVKTRSDRNWDETGKLAITPQKQSKIWKAAQVFLTQHPHLAEQPCRFDVALVQCEKLSGAIDLSQINGDTRIVTDGYQLTLYEYLPDAFCLE